MRPKRGPRIVTDDLVIRSYEFGEVKGSITLASSTPLDVVGSSIVKRFHHDDSSYFRTELKNGVYVVSEKVHLVNPPTTVNTFIEWKNAMLSQHPDYVFNALNSVEMIPPLLLSAIIVPNVIYSHRLDNGRFYYAVPIQYKPIRLSGTSKLMQRAAEILDGYVGLQSVSMIGILGTSAEDCGFSPASFKFVDGAVFQWGPPVATQPQPPPAPFTESTSCLLATRILALMSDYPDHSPFIGILKRYQPPNFDYEHDEVDIGSLPVQALQEIEAYFIKKRADLKQSVLQVLGKRKLTALTKKFGDFASINYATFCEIEKLIAAAPPPPPPKLSHEELPAKAREIKANIVEAIEELQNELKRSCGKVVRTDHIVTNDVGACYKAPTEEEIRRQIADSSSSSSSD